ncbi:MAG: C-terminal target protein [Bacteroidetes bacterium]|jgi:flagellar hook assembly protein FlgD|nr:C-terminal target protein [Bacteroidota bacterium]
MTLTKKYSLTLLFVISVVTGFSQIQWQKSLGGSDTEQSVQVLTCPGGYIVAGSTSSNDGDVSGNHGTSDVWIVKLDQAGTVLWKKIFGGTGDENATAICRTNDLGYIITAWSNSNDGDVSGNHGNYDIWVIKIDSVGTMQWQRSFGGSGKDQPSGVIQTADGGYMVSGTTYTNNNGDVSANHGAGDIWLVKLDASGSLQWQKCYGGSGNEEVSKVGIRQLPDGGYIVSGSTLSNNGDVSGNHGFADYWIFRLDSSGTIQWQKTLGGNSCDYSESIELTPDGGYIVIGGATSDNGDITDHISFCTFCPGMGSYVYQCMDYWITKLDSSGTVEWKKSIGGSTGDFPFHIHAAGNGSYIIGGMSQSADGNVSANHGGMDFWAVNIDSLGNILWEKSFGGTGDDNLYTDICRTTDGGYVLCCTSASNDGDVSGNHGSTDIWVAKIGDPIGLAKNNRDTGIKIYPNPSSGSVTFSNLEGICLIELYDALGKLVKKVTTTEGSCVVSLDAKGFYQYSVISASGIVKTGKLLVE